MNPNMRQNLTPNRDAAQLLREQRGEVAEALVNAQAEVARLTTRLVTLNDILEGTSDEE